MLNDFHFNAPLDFGHVQFVYTTDTLPRALIYTHNIWSVICQTGADVTAEFSTIQLFMHIAVQKMQQYMFTWVK